MNELKTMEKQLVNELSKEMQSWKYSNDIESPSIYSDIKEICRKYTNNKDFHIAIAGRMQEILKEIRQEINE